MNGTGSGGIVRLTNMKRVIGTTVATGAALLTIAACGTTHAPPGGAGAAPAGTATPASTSSAGSGSTAASESHAAAASTAGTHKQIAEADAKSILASFAVPPGAVRLSAAPASASGLGRAPVVFATTNLVDDTSWWRVPGQPQAVLAWEASHLPSRFTASGQSTIGSGATTVWADQFTLPVESGVLSARELSVQAVSVGGGQTALRVDADDTWIPVKPASEQIPAAVKAVTVSVTPGMVATVRVPTPVTITDPMKVRELVGVTNALPVWSGLHVMCPADFGESVRLTFTATPGGPALATAVASVSGCGLANLTVNGKQQLPLSEGSTLARRALALAGMGALSTRLGGPLPGGRVNPGGPMVPGS